MLKHKVKEFMTRKGYLIGAFFIPIIIMYTILCFMGLYPFGKYSSMVIDEGAQYIYYLEYFRDALLGKGSLLYSWSRTLGGEMLGISSYYLASPFSLIMLIFPIKYSTEAMLTIKLLKLGCCSLSFASYIRLSKKATKTHTVIFSVLYALMSFIVVQIENIMWVDAIILFPIMILSVERIIHEKKYILFTFVCSLLFITNYYMGYMVGIFSFFYFVYYYFSSEQDKSMKDFLKKFGIYIRSAIIAVMCSAFVLLPVYYSLKLGKFGFNNPSYMPDSLFELFDLFTKMLPSSYDTLRSGGLPVIYCGIMTLFLLPLYFLNSNITTKQKFISASLLVVMICSFQIKTLDLVWHGFQLPNDLPYRYAFMFSFMLLLLAYEAFKNIRALPFKTIAIVYGVLCFLVLLVEKLGYEYIDTQECIWLSLFCLSCLLVYFYLERTYQHSKFPKIFLFILLTIEIVTNTATNMWDLHQEFVFHQREPHRTAIDTTRPIIKTLSENDPSFYRVEKTYFLWENDPMGINMRGLSHSSSLPHAKVLKFLKQVGYGAGMHKSLYNGSTMLTDALLGFKYILSKDDNLSYYPCIMTEDEIGIYENPFVLPIAYMASDRIGNLELRDSNPFINQNRLLSEILGDEYTEYFKPINRFDIAYKNISKSVIENSNEYAKVDKDDIAQVEFSIETGSIDNYVYAYFPTGQMEKADLYVNGNKVASCFEKKVNYIVPVGLIENSEETTVALRIVNEKMYFDRAQFYYLDMELFNEAIDRLKTQSLVVTHFKDTKLEGKVDVKGDKTILFTSIPYEKGWKVKVDGKEVDTIEACNTFLAIPLSEGNHTITLTFLPKELVLGYTLSIIGWIIFMGIIIRGKITHLKEE